MIRTGLILGMHRNTTADTAAMVTEQLRTQYPGVIVTVVAGCVDSLAFPFEDGELPPPNADQEAAMSHDHPH